MLAESHTISGAPAIVRPSLPKIRWPHENERSLNEFFGDPRGRGRANPKWEAENLVRWTPPYPMFYSGDPREPMEHLELHKKVAPYFTAAFEAVLKELGADYIRHHHLNITGGTNCYRLQRGGSRLSVHAWAIAIDMDPQRNPFPGRHGMMDLHFVEIVSRYGLWWRGSRDGTSSSPGSDDDPMHFQCAIR